ncbi:MAG: ABC transporter permease [Ruminococcus sp.]|jgi:ABC-2 type transport system permease protein
MTTEGKRKRQYAFVIRQLTAREIKRKYARSYLGILWSVLNPLLSMLVLSLIFSKMFQKSIENFPIYYLTGYILWQTFTGATTAAMTALTDNKLLLLKVKFPMEIFIVTRVYTAAVNFLYSLAAYGVMLAVFEIRIQITAALFPVILFFLFLFSLGMSFILATGYVFFGDLKHLYTVALTLWMYCSGIFYPAEQLEGIIQKIVFYNPMYVYIRCLRKAVMYGEIPTGGEVWQMVLWGSAVCLAGWLIFQKNRNKIMEWL